MNLPLTAVVSAITTENLSKTLLFILLGIIAVAAIIGLLINAKNKEKLRDFAKYATGIAIGFSLASIGIMLFVVFDEMVSGGDFSKALFWPICAFLLLMILLSVIGLIISILKKDFLTQYSKIAFIVAGLYALTVFIIYLVNQYKESFVLSDDLGLIFGTLALCGAVVVLCFLFGKKTPDSMATKSIVYAAVCIALSFALSYMRLFRLPQGGSITFASILPLLIYSYIFGIRKGVLAGLIYGVLQAIQDPWIIHPLQFILDYPAAFMMLGLAGLFKSLPVLKNNVILKFLLGSILAAILRYFCHVITGIIVFGSYAAEGFNAVSWGFVYNLFVFADAAIALVLGVLMLSVKSFRKYVLSINPTVTIKESQSK